MSCYLLPSEVEEHESALSFWKKCDLNPFSTNLSPFPMRSKTYWWTVFPWDFHPQLCSFSIFHCQPSQQTPKIHFSVPRLFHWYPLNEGLWSNETDLTFSSYRCWLVFDCLWQSSWKQELTQPHLLWLPQYYLWQPRLFWSDLLHFPDKFIESKGKLRNSIWIFYNFEFAWKYARYSLWQHLSLHIFILKICPPAQDRVECRFFQIQFDHKQKCRHFYHRLSSEPTETTQWRHYIVFTSDQKSAQKHSLAHIFQVVVCFFLFSRLLWEYFMK